MSLGMPFTPLGDITNTQSSFTSMMNSGMPLKSDSVSSFMSNDSISVQMQQPCRQLSNQQLLDCHVEEPMRWTTTSLNSQTRASAKRQNDPYNWNWNAEEQPPVPAASLSQPRLSISPPNTLHSLHDTPKPSPIATPQLMPPFSTTSFEPLSTTLTSASPSPAPGLESCRALVQFKCHQAEFSSSIILQRGQYVVVQGDRGVDIGVVARINTHEKKQYVEKHGPSGHVMRHANQREVDYWATELRQDEANALACVQLRVVRMGLAMEVKHAEYQFDKKKLTFYYDAKTRVDFVPLLKDLFREFNCRIWMEKVRLHE